MKNKLKLLVCALGASLSLGAAASSMPQVTFEAKLFDQVTVSVKKQDADYVSLGSLEQFKEKRFLPDQLATLGFAAEDIIKVKFQNERGSFKTCPLRRLNSWYLGFVMYPGSTDSTLPLELASCQVVDQASQKPRSQVELIKYNQNTKVELLVQTAKDGYYYNVFGPSDSSGESPWIDNYYDIDFQLGLQHIGPEERVNFAILDSDGMFFQCAKDVTFQGNYSFVFDTVSCHSSSETK